jgi:two-component system chemotaxis response regulator CheB
VATAIRVLVVDDSAFMRTAVARTLASEKGIEVIGQAKDGAEAVQRVRELRPDVVTMDFNMPRMNGAQAIRAIFDERPVPIVMLSAHTYDGAKETLEALRAGAVDFVTKPDGEVSTDLASIKDELLRKIKAAAKSRPMRAGPEPAPAKRTVGSTSGSFAAYTPPGETTERRERISFSSLLDPAVIIAVSTGGPAALEHVIPKLPSEFPHGLLVVQHMPAQFTRALASRLDSIAKLQVREAQEGDRIMAGTVLVAPGDRHVVVEKTGMLRLTGTPPVNGCRPSADVTFQSAAPVYGSRLVAVIMTGMGRDGALGATAVKAARGRIIVQDRESSVVYGMPKAVAEMGLADEEVTLDGIAVSLVRHADRYPT